MGGLTYKEWLENRQSIFPNCPRDTESVVWGEIVWQAAQNAESQAASTNTGSPKLPTVEELIDSISSDHNRWNEAIAHDPLWIAMIKITHDIISRQLRAGA
jgi:hypothetical protein